MRDLSLFSPWEVTMTDRVVDPPQKIAKDKRTSYSWNITNYNVAQARVFPVHTGETEQLSWNETNKGTT